MRLIVRLLCIVRALLMPAILVVWTFVLSSIGLFCALVVKKRSVDNWVIRTWCGGICFFVGIRIHLYGLENIPSGGVLYAFNHQSLMDIPVIHTGIPRDFRFGAKVELFKIPVFGHAMKYMGALKIARTNRSEAIQVLEEAAKKMNEGYSFILAPEGTRQKQPELGEFKSGPFIMAIQAKRPIVPVVINGIHKLLPKKSLLINTQSWYCDVDLLILKPVDGAEFNFANRDDFKDLVRAQMKAAYRVPQDS